MKKLFGLGLVVLLFSFVAAQGVDHESKQSVYVLEQNGSGSSSMQHSLLYTPLSRWEAATLFGAYADEILDREVDTDAACTFWDVTDASIVYAEILKSCQLGLLKGSNGNFNPYASMTRGQLIIVVARMLSQDSSLELDTAYNYLLQQGVIKVDDRVNSTRVPGRNEVYIMLARFLHNPASSSAQPIKQTLLVRTYTHDPLFGNFVVVSEGSAVLLPNNTLLTNAHVVSDELGEPTGFYEVCRVESIGKDPVCFSSAILQRFDSFEDLALLQLTKSYTAGQVATLRTRALRAGDSVTVVGFPYDGGNTITTTKGIVAGFDGEMVKTDAAVNYGNSGGGAYDGQGQLVGVPTSLYGNIGYLVPVSTIQSFLEDDTVIFSAQDAMQAQFAPFMQSLAKQHTLLASARESLTTDYFAIADLQGFVVSAVHEYKQGEIATASYSLTTTDKKASVLLDVYHVLGEKSLSAHVDEIRNLLVEDYGNIVTEEKVIAGNDWYVITADDGYYDTDALTIWYIYMKNGGLFTVKVGGSKSQSSLLSQIQSLVASIESLQIPAKSSSPLSLGFVTAPVPSFASVEISTDAATKENSLSYDISDLESYGSLSIERCGCDLSEYPGEGIQEFMVTDSWYDEDVNQAETFTTVDGFQGYYIDNMWEGSRVFYAVIKVVDPYHPDTVFSVVFEVRGDDQITDAHIAQFKSYVQSLRIVGKNPFAQ